MQEIKEYNLDVMKPYESEFYNIITNTFIQYQDKIGKEIEIELRLGHIRDSGNFDSGVNKSYFEGMLNSFKKRIWKVNNEIFIPKTQVTIDVSLKGNIRVTFVVEKNGDLKVLEVIRKSKIEKTNYKTNKNFDLRMGISEEIILEKNERESAIELAKQYIDNSKEKPTNDNIFRRKERTSFIDDNKCRYDITVVQTSNKLSKIEECDKIFEIEYEMSYYKDNITEMVNYNIMNIFHHLFAIDRKYYEVRNEISDIFIKVNHELKCMEFKDCNDIFFNIIKENSYNIPENVVNQIKWMKSFASPIISINGIPQDFLNDSSNDMISITNLPGRVNFHSKEYFISAFLFICQVPNTKPLKRKLE